MDQIQYLTEGYTGYERARQLGLLEGVWNAVLKPSAQGMLYAPISVILFAVVGPSRIAALSLNLFAFLILQITLAYLLRQINRSWRFVWLGVGLLLCVQTPVETGPGSAIDYRLDWMACCAFGVALATCILADGMRARMGSVAFGLATGLTILLRFITATYFAGIYLLLVMWLLLGVLHRRGRNESIRRLAHLTLAALVAVMLTLPVLWFNRDWVYNYYWVGHITGTESAVRAFGSGVVRSLGFVTDALVWYHLRPLFLGVWCVIVVIPLLTLTIRGIRASPGNIMFRPRFAPAFACTLIFFAVPFIILTLHRQKSEIVVSVLILPTVLLGLLLAGIFTRPLVLRWRHRIIGSLAALAMFCGLWHFSSELIRSPHSDAFVADAQRVNALADYLFHASIAAGLGAPRIAVDQVTDSLDAQIMRVICYERQKIWVPFVMTLPTGVIEDQEDRIMAKLAESDFVFLTDQMEGEGAWPYDRQMHRLYPALVSWSQQNLKKVEQFVLFGRKITLYQRREIP